MEPKGHSIELHVGDVDHDEIRGILAELGSPWHYEVHPHVSLAVIREEIDQPGLRQIVREVVPKIPTLTLRFASVGLFPGRRPVVFLAPTANAELLEAHGLVADALDAAGISPIEYYRPGFWTPHLTICKGLPGQAFDPQFKTLTRTPITGPRRFESIRLVEFHPARLLENLPLNNK